MVADFARHVDEDQVIVFDQNGVLGYAIVRVDRRTTLLDNIAVDPAAQHQGIGGALIAAVERQVIASGRQSYELYTNVVMTDSLRWYRKLGFVETARVEEKGFSRIYMRRDLGTNP